VIVADCTPNPRRIDRYWQWPSNEPESVKQVRYAKRNKIAIIELLDLALPIFAVDQEQDIVSYGIVVSLEVKAVPHLRDHPNNGSRTEAGENSRDDRCNTQTHLLSKVEVDTR
jgi:hypothetical protein